MKAQNTNNGQVNVVIIARSTFENPHTDDCRAWGYDYTLLFPDTNELGYECENTGYGDNLKDSHKDWNFVEINDEYRKQYEQIVKENAIRSAERKLAEYQQELDEYNAKKLPQEKGQVVRVVTGKKHTGKVGKISWFGKSKFNHSYTNKYSGWKAYAIDALVKSRPYHIPNKDLDLIRVVSVDGSFEPFYINPAQCEVIDGYKEVTIKLEDVLGFNKHTNDCYNAISGNYDHIKY